MVRIGEWTLDADRGLLARGGERRRLEPRVLAVLCYLVERPGRLVSREELWEGVWNRQAVEDGALTRSVGQIRKALGDDARAPTYLQTVPKRGYRLIAPVTVSAESRLPESPTPRGGTAGEVPSGRWRRVGLPQLLAAASVALVVWLVGAAGDPPTVAVAAFHDLSPPASSERGRRWAAGVDQEILAGLSSIAPLRVVALDATPVGGKAATTADLILSGTVRAHGDEVRASCQLVSAGSGVVRCAGTCDLPAEGALEGQREIARQVVAAVAGELGAE